ncbi:MAG: FAD-dependent oxidoreductase [Proteobacteria bacterium]|nr:FAD-dependent oxidoreductase [Pseudomonadota bacterium]
MRRDDLPGMTHDLIVIGAGPAGMAAAATGAELGLRTLLLDEQASYGGQIYRNVTACDPKVSALLGADYMHGASLAKRLSASGTEVHHDTLVWDVARDLTVTALHAGRAKQWRAPQLVAATGAMERASPLPGWTLPGVMNAGAVQLAIKSAGTVPAGRIAVVGAGPLVLLVACQLLDAGASVAAIVETAPAANVSAAARLLPRALRAWPMLAKGLRMMWRLMRAGVPWFTRAEGVQLLGTDTVQAVSFRARGASHRIDADHVLLHHGVIPNTQLSRLLRLEHRWDERQLSWHVVTDAFGQTSLAGLRMAGDGTAIAGAYAAEAAGELAALGAAQALGRIDGAALSMRADPLRRALAAQLAIRPFLDELYRPPKAITHPRDEIIVCRCEEVSAGKIREMARLGCVGPNQTKFFSRCGMGPCQGRVCGNVVTQVLADELGIPPGEVGAYRIRAPLKPIPLGALAGLAEDAPPSLSKSVANGEHAE